MIRRERTRDERDERRSRPRVPARLLSTLSAQLSGGLQGHAARPVAARRAPRDDAAHAAGADGERALRHRRPDRHHQCLGGPSLDRAPRRRRSALRDRPAVQRRVHLRSVAGRTGRADKARTSPAFPMRSIARSRSCSRQSTTPRGTWIRVAAGGWPLPAPRDRHPRAASEDLRGCHKDARRSVDWFDETNRPFAGFETRVPEETPCPRRTPRIVVSIDGYLPARCHR